MANAIIVHNWPLCTLNDCRCMRTSDDERAYRRDISEHPDWVDKVGRAVCRCHGDTARQMGLTAFECNDVRGPR